MVQALAARVAERDNFVMTDSNLKALIQEHMKEAMKAKDQRKLGVIRLILAAIKQVEVDTRAQLDNTAILAVLDKMLKQRRDSKQQYEQANRMDLADQEAFEIRLIETYLPAQLTDKELQDIIKNTIQETQAAGPKDMGKVMAAIKPKVQGRTDMRQVSELIKQALAN